MIDIQFILLFISLSYIINLFVWQFEPLQKWKGLIKNNRYTYYLIYIINCVACSSFWFGLIFYQSIITALLFSLTAQIIEKIIR